MNILTRKSYFFISGLSSCIFLLSFTVYFYRDIKLAIMKEKYPVDPAELFESIKKGNIEAKNYLFQVLRARVLHVAKQYLNENDVEDLVQDTMKTFCEKFDELNHPEAVLLFCLQILKNKIGNFLQRKPVQVTVPLERADLRTHDNPQSLFESEELQAKIRAAIESLGKRSAEFRKLSTLLRSGYSMQEIASAFGDKNKQALYSRIYRFRKRLKEVLRKEYGLEI